jgi:hypothetical protein
MLKEPIVFRDKLSLPVVASKEGLQMELIVRIVQEVKDMTQVIQESVTHLHVLHPIKSLAHLCLVMNAKLAHQIQ